MAKAEQTKEQRVKSEIRKLEKNFKDIEEKRKNVAKGLIERAAFLKISLEDLERDINENGVTELFSQGDQKPYLRKRPAAEIYNNFNGNYQKIIKQLTDLLPKEAPAPKVGDEFDNF